MKQPLLFPDDSCIRCVTVTVMSALTAPHDSLDMLQYGSTSSTAVI